MSTPEPEMHIVCRDSAARRFDTALLRLAVDGGRPRCGEFGGHELWLSENPEERALAKSWCAGCPVIDECAAAATELKVSFGVWAGRDRTKQTRKGATR